MRKFYVIGLIAALCIMMYFVGRATGTAACREHVAAVATENLVAQYTEIVQTQRQINAETFNLGVADIRDRLRRDYTIAE